MSGKPNRGKYWSPENPVDDISRDERESLCQAVKDRLTNYRLTQVWLIQRLGANGLTTDKSEMSSVLAGVRIGSKADEILRRSMSILDEYAAKFGDGT